MVGNQGLYLFGMNVNSTKLFKIANILRKENIFVKIDLNKKTFKTLNLLKRKGINCGDNWENELKANTITIKILKMGNKKIFH